MPKGEGGGGAGWGAGCPGFIITWTIPATTMPAMSGSICRRAGVATPLTRSRLLQDGLAQMLRAEELAHHGIHLRLGLRGGERGRVHEAEHLGKAGGIGGGVALEAERQGRPSALPWPDGSDPATIRIAGRNRWRP